MSDFVNGSEFLKRIIDEIGFNPEDFEIVVRCKDCMFYEPFREHDGFCRIDGMLWNESCYCSYGERKDGADGELQ